MSDTDPGERSPSSPSLRAIRDVGKTVSVESSPSDVWRSRFGTLGFVGWRVVMVVLGLLLTPLFWIWGRLSTGQKTLVVMLPVVVLGLSVFLFFPSGEGDSSVDIASEGERLDEVVATGPRIDMSVGEMDVLSPGFVWSDVPLVPDENGDPGSHLVMGDEDTTEENLGVEAHASVPLPPGLPVWNEAVERMLPVSFRLGSGSQINVEETVFLFVNAERDVRRFESDVQNLGDSESVRVVPLGTSALSMLVGQIPVCALSGVPSTESGLSLEQASLFWERSHGFIAQTLASLNTRLADGAGRAATDQWMEETFSGFLTELVGDQASVMEECLWTRISELEEAVGWVLSRTESAPSLPFALVFDQDQGFRIQP